MTRAVKAIYQVLSQNSGGLGARAVIHPRSKQAASQHALIYAQKPLLEAANVGHDPARSTSSFTAFCTCLSKKLLSQEQLPYCTRKQHSHRNTKSCLLPHPSLRQWRVGAFLLLEHIISFLPTNWLDSKEKFKDSLHTFKTAGMPCIQTLFCRQQSSAQAEWILCHLTCPPNRVPKGELWKRVIRENSHSNSNECFNLWQRPYCLWRKKYFLPNQISSSCRIVALFWELFSPDRKYCNTSKLWSSLFHQEKETFKAVWTDLKTLNNL